MVYEKHEEYMKRRLREEEAAREKQLIDDYEERAWKDLENRLKLQKEFEKIPPKYPQRKKIYESPDGGKTVYQRNFGQSNRKVLEGSSKLHTKYKYNEDNLIAEFKEYIDATYGQHYSRDKFQATEFIMDGGHGTGFCIGNVLKYAQRYGKKGTKDDARKDLMKVLHYALLQLYVHDNDL